jgi:hypothetical protein
MDTNPYESPPEQAEVLAPPPRRSRMNGFDKFCAVLAFGLGAVFLLLGTIGLVVGCSAHFTLPPVLGVVPALVGWGIVRAIYLAWKGSGA